MIHDPGILHLVSSAIPEAKFRARGQSGIGCSYADCAMFRPSFGTTYREAQLSNANSPGEGAKSG